MDPHHRNRQRVSTTLYNASTGAGGSPASASTYSRIVHSITGFASWTHIVSANKGSLLSYNAERGDGGSACIDFHGNYNFVEKISGFTKGWTHITGTASGGVLFYNASTGEGADRLHRRRRILQFRRFHLRIQKRLDPHRGCRPAVKVRLTRFSSPDRAVSPFSSSPALRQLLGSWKDLLLQPLKELDWSGSEPSWLAQLGRPETQQSCHQGPFGLSKWQADPHVEVQSGRKGSRAPRTAELMRA